MGAGIALGHATCGEVGFEDRSDYAAIGAVTNLAARLADEAAAGQVLITQRLHAEVDEHVEVEPIGDLSLKGFRSPVPALNVIAVHEPGANASAPDPVGVTVELSRADP
jgi:adenylate cyclase